LQSQFNGGSEYTSRHFQSFLTNNGIQHRKSFPHTSQQNGLAKRKLHHILETGLTLLARSDLSNRYWVDAFLTSVFIINRLPTSVLNHASPFEKLFLKSLDYSLLRVFGCKCFPLLHPYTTHKLEFQSKVCIFLGYSHAVFRCLDLVTNHVYLSRHVVIYEQSFLAKEHDLLQLPSKINAVFDAPSKHPCLYIFSLPHHTHHAATNSTHHAATESNHDYITTTSPSDALSSLILTFEPLDIVDHHASFSSLSPASPIVVPPPAALVATIAPALYPMTTQYRTGSLRPTSFPDFHLYSATKHTPPTALHSVLTEV